MDGFLRYDTRLKERARENRKNPTIAENLAWEKIFSRKQFYGFKFTRQKMLSGFIVDFYCSALQLVVEIDGEIHKNRWDMIVREAINSMNYDSEFLDIEMKKLF